CSGGLSAIARSLVWKHALGCGQNGQTGGGRFFCRSSQALHILVWPDWRLFSRAFLFRGGSIAGAAISRGRLAQRESSRFAFQCRCESANAIFHSAARCDRFHVLSIRKTTRLFQSAGVPTCDGERLCATASGVENAIR